MKVSACVLFLFLVPVVLKAQRVQVGFNAGPTIGYRYLRTDSETFKNLFRSEREVIRYNLGVDVVFRAGANWQVGTGLHYGSRGYSQRLQMVDVNGGNLADFKLEDHFDYLDVPVFFKYRFGLREKRSFYSLAGVNNSFLLRHETVSKGGPALPASPDLALRRYNFGVITGFGMRFELSDKVSFEAGPQATLQLQHLFEGDTFVKRYLYAAGLNFRAAYDF